ncbi:MAG: molybdopterin molybdotransferase MoeA [Phycisphaerales bacterium]
MTDLPDYREALRQALTGIEPFHEVQSVALNTAAGRVLRESIAADRDLPPFDRAQMDGYALRAAEVGRIEAWPVVHTISAGMSAQLDVPTGACVAIATGAPLPGDVDTVIQHELSDRSDPVRFTIDSIEPGHAVHRRGADAKRGDVLVDEDTLLGSQQIGIAAIVGKSQLAVARRPRAIVLTSGDEVLPIDQPLRNYQIRNSNGPMVRELLRRIGADPTEHRHILDDREATIGSVGDALERCELLITVGGISAGERDYFPASFKAYGVESSLHGAAIQPGRPIFVGRPPNGAIIIGLPGNPVSVLACTCLFIWPIVRTLLGLEPSLPWRTLELAEVVTPNPNRRAYRPAALLDNDRAKVPPWAGSGDLVHTAGTDGLIELPVQPEPVPPGTRVRFLPYP